MTDTVPTAAPQATVQPPSLYRAVASAAHRLQRELLGQNSHLESNARSVLSRLRRAVASDLGEDPLAWWAVSEEVLGDLPEGDIGRGDEPSFSEWAAFTAITLFAVHQQSQSAPMHVAAVDLGRAVGTLRRRSDSGSVKQRLDAVMLAPTPTAQRYHLRSLITLLSSHGIGLDYGRLAEDLRALRHPRSRPGVVVRWGREYAAALHAQPGDVAD